MSDIRDELSLFHWCAAAAWLDVTRETGQWPPDSELTRRRAYQLYENELRERRSRDKPLA